MEEMTLILPTSRDIELREKQIRDATNRKLSDTEITTMLKQKEKFSLFKHAQRKTSTWRIVFLFRIKKTGDHVGFVSTENS